MCSSDLNLEFATLIGSDFWSCNLENANLWKAHCQGVNFLSGNLKSATLTGANLSRANLEDACLEYANLTNVDLRFVNMSRSNFEHANMTGVLFNKHSNYRGIRTDSSYGSPCFKRFANDQDFVEEFKEIVWDPLLYWRDEKCQTWAKPIPMGLYLYWFWDVTSDCGRSLLRWSLFSVFLAVVYGFIFYYLGESSFHINQYGSQQLPWSIATTMYFSVITFSTLGYGDIVPITSLATLFIIAEVITGYIMLGGLISILAGKMARRA